MIERVLLSESAIGARLDSLAREIDEAYAGREILAVGVLKGSVFFLTDLLKRLKTPVSVDFLQVRSYAGTSSSGNIQLVHDLSMDVEGKHVLLFEDVVDTGLTLRKIIELLSSRHPRSLRIAALLKKDLAENRDLKVDFLGFTIGKEFVVGYGLDLDEKYRNLPEIATAGAREVRAGARSRFWKPVTRVSRPSARRSAPAPHLRTFVRFS